MEPHLQKSLDLAVKRLESMSAEQLYEEMFGERDRNRARALELAPAISKLIIDNDIHFVDHEFHYFPERYQVLLDHFPKEDILVFAQYLDLDNPAIVLFSTTYEEIDFPNEQFHTKFGVTFDVMWGQGTSIRIYKTVEVPRYTDDNKFILSEN